MTIAHQRDYTSLEEDDCHHFRSPVVTPFEDCQRASFKSIAEVAVAQRDSDMMSDIIPIQDAKRDSIRLISAFARRDLPSECEKEGTVYVKWKQYLLTLTQFSLRWTSKSGAIKGFIDSGDIVGAEALEPRKSKHVVRVHAFHKGKNSKRLLRKHKTYDFITADDKQASSWVHAIQELVRWQARVPDTKTKRKIKVIVNPHSGKRRAPKPILLMAGFEPHVEETKCSGHAVDMGKSYSVDNGFEALVFIGGDGTICEYMNGLLTRPENEWRDIVLTTPLSLISAGTQNAFGIGVGIPTLGASLYSIIKRKIRPLDVITAAGKDSKVIQYSCCGIGWGIAGDIAQASEQYRWMGTKRYAFLKLRFTLFPRKHTGTIRYVPTHPQPELREYDKIRNVQVGDQFSAEEDNVYYDDLHPSSANCVRSPAWNDHVNAIRNPAGEENYLPEQWKEISGQFIVVGALTSTPDGKYTHPSDGNVDLVVCRRGSIWREIQMAVYYLMGKEFDSPLLEYIKAKAIIITQDQEQYGCNIDGEVFEGPGPFRFEIVPSLFKVLSEK